MASVNKVHILGNVGQDPTIRYLPSGQAVANISVATTSKRKDQNGETIEDTQWHRVTLYERLAEIVGEYVKKGHPIYIEGRIKYGKYTDDNGVEKNTCDIVATSVQLLASRSDDNQQQGTQRQQRQAPQRRQQTPAQGNAYRNVRNGAPPPPQPARQAPPRPSSGFDDMDDDIPY